MFDIFLKLLFPTKFVDATKKSEKWEKLLNYNQCGFILKTSIDCTPNQRRGVAVLLQCTALEQNFGMVSTVAEVLWSKITAPEQIFGLSVALHCSGAKLHS